MKTIAKLSDIKKGESRSFDHNGKNAILVRTREDDLVAYYTNCPHEDGTVEWDPTLNTLLCECHMAIFNVSDGSLRKCGRGMKIEKGLKHLNVTVDDTGSIHII